MSSGKLLKNPGILLRYFDILEKMGIDRSLSLPTSSDLEFIAKAVRLGSLNLLEVLQLLTKRFIPRVVRGAARKAVEEVLGKDVDEELAVEIVAKDLALWTIEIAENLSLVKLDTSILR